MKVDQYSQVCLQMIRLSRLADYGVVLMSHIAFSQPTSHNAQAVARATAIPLPTTSKLLSTLAGAGVLAAVRGTKGGYKLARRPEQISLADIISAIDGPIALTQCIEHGPGHCELEGSCRSRTGWHTINRAVRKAMENVSLADLLTPPLMPAEVECVPDSGDRERPAVDV
jgi:FeS assembly SUF system regulator